MTVDIRWIAPMFGFDANCTHLGVPENGKSKLLDMSDRVVGRSVLVAIYIPEGTEDVYQAGAKRGRVVGAVRLLEMPDDKTIEDYFYDDWDGSRRWPYGWPCEPVYAPPVSLCPPLREHIEHLNGNGSFAGYVSRFQLGPFELEPDVRDALNGDFEELPRLDT
jgi:hypothetical protein